MSDDNPSGEIKADLEGITKAAERLLQNGAQEAEIRVSEKETCVVVKSPPPSSRWAVLWMAAKALFGRR